MFALAAGLSWCVVSLLSIAERGPADYLDILVVAPFSLTLLAFVGLHGLQADRLGRLGRVSFWISSLGMAAGLVGQAGIIADVDALKILGFPIGALAWFAGFALYGIATARAGALPAWMGVAIALSEPLTIATAVALSPISPVADHGNFSGAIAHGLIWLAVGRAMRARAEAQTAGRAPQQASARA